MKQGNSRGATPPSGGARTLAVDVGGTRIKASVLDSAGRMVADRVRMATPYPCVPDVLLQAVVELSSNLPDADRISIGFPGVTRRGRVITARRFGVKEWRDYPLESTLMHRFGKP